MNHISISILCLILVSVISGATALVALSRNRANGIGGGLFLPLLLQQTLM
jgi:hypothetical protein